jgi:hypothetical protein
METSGSTPASVSTTCASSSVSTGSSINDSPKQSGTKRDFCFSQNPLPGGQDLSLKRTSLSTNYGAKVLNKESETADEFEEGAAAFIVRVDKSDATIGFNISYVLVSILNYMEKDYDIRAVGATTNPNFITVDTMTKLLSKFKVRSAQINSSHVDIITGTEHIGKSILLVYEVHRYDCQEKETGGFPSIWTHFCLYFQENKVLLTFNQKNINYKFGKIIQSKKEDGTFDDYATETLYKKIYPVARMDTTGIYSLKRKMTFRTAFIILAD